MNNYGNERQQHEIEKIKKKSDYRLKIMTIN